MMASPQPLAMGGWTRRGDAVSIPERVVRARWRATFQKANGGDVGPWGRKPNAFCSWHIRFAALPGVHIMRVLLNV